MRRELRTHVLIALLGCWAFHVSPVRADVDPGEIVQIGTEDSDHGVLEEPTVFGRVSTSPDRVQLFAERELVGAKAVSGFMSRDFTVSPSATPSGMELASGRSSVHWRV